MNTMKKVLIFVLFIFISINISFSKSWYQRDISSLLYNKYLQYQTEENFYDLVKKWNLVNLYQRLYQINLSKQAKSINAGKKFVNSVLKEQWCWDVNIDILLWWFNYGIFSESSKVEKIESKQIKDQCRKLLKCLYKKTDQQIQALPDDILLTNCYKHVGNLLMLWALQDNLVRTAKDYNMANEVFINWTVEDSPYDLLVDIYQIKKIIMGLYFLSQFLKKIF